MQDGPHEFGTARPEFREFDWCKVPCKKVDLATVSNSYVRTLGLHMYTCTQTASTMYLVWCLYYLIQQSSEDAEIKGNC